MAGNSEKDDLLRRLLEAASETWGRSEVENMRSAFEAFAEAFLKVEAFKLKPMEEPAQQTAIFSQAGLRGGLGKGRE